MIPGPPLMLQNFLLSMLNIPHHIFLISTIIGISPVALFCVLIGNKINNLKDITSVSFSNIFTWDLILIIFFIIFILLLKVLFKKN